MSTILHTIVVHLHKSQLNSDVERYYGRVKHERTISLRQVCVTACNRGGLRENPKKLEMDFLNIWNEIAYQLCDGFAVNFGFGILKLAIRGEFNSINDEFDPERHQLDFTFTPLKPLCKYFPSTNVRVENDKSTNAYIESVIDLETKNDSGLITAGRMIQIKGKNIKILPEHDENTGVSFIDANGIEWREDHYLVQNSMQKILVHAPLLPPGIYTLRITTRYSGGGKLLSQANTIEYPEIVVAN